VAKINPGNDESREKGDMVLIGIVPCRLLGRFNQHDGQGDAPEKAGSDHIHKKPQLLSASGREIAGTGLSSRPVIVESSSCSRVDQGWHGQRGTNFGSRGIEKSPARGFYQGRSGGNYKRGRVSETAQDQGQSIGKAVSTRGATTTKMVFSRTDQDTAEMGTEALCTRGEGKGEGDGMGSLVQPGATSAGS
jgi:hypothetical protein